MYIPQKGLGEVLKAYRRPLLVAVVLLVLAAGIGAAIVVGLRGWHP